MKKSIKSNQLSQDDRVKRVALAMLSVNKEDDLRSNSSSYRGKSIAFMPCVLSFSKMPKDLRAPMKYVNQVFTKLLYDYRPDLFSCAPYKVNITELVEKNQWTAGTYVAINNPDGTLDLRLNFKKLLNKKLFPEFPTARLVWVLMHEFRHKVQLTDPILRESLAFPNWQNFNKFMQAKFNKNEDLINHIFHELNPAEVDANMFACEMTGLAFKGNAFDINDQSLKLLEE